MQCLFINAGVCCQRKFILKRNPDEKTHNRKEDNKCCFELKKQVDTLLSELVSARERFPTLLRELATAEERYSTLLEDYQAERRRREELEKSLFILPD